MPRGVTPSGEMRAPGGFAKGGGKARLYGAKGMGKGKGLGKGAKRTGTSEKQLKEIKAFTKKQATIEGEFRKKNCSDDRLIGIVEGIVADKIINKTEKPSWNAAKGILREEGKHTGIKTPKRTYKIPEIPKDKEDEIHELYIKAYKKAVGEKSKHTRTPKAEKPEKPKKERRKAQYSAKYDGGRNLKDFDKDVKMALTNPFVRRSMAHWIIRSAPPEWKDRAGKVWNWKKWWRVPTRSSGEPYKQLNGGVEAVLRKHNQTLAEAKAEIAELLK